VDPVEGRALVACRETVASAQAAYDDSRFDECLRLLRTAGEIGERSEMWYDYTLETKVLGLRAIASWGLGRHGDAVDTTLRALVWSWLIGDALGVGVYWANLTQMRAESAAGPSSSGMHGVLEPAEIMTKADALRWVEAAAADGDPDCAYLRGVAWLRDPPSDQGRAALMFEDAARRGHIRAALRLGRLLAGQGYKEAARPWLTAAADAGCAAALMPLAAILMDSADEADVQQSVRLVGVAAAAGDPHARKAMRMLNDAEGESDM
jgi:hypothetical protein